jgi:hypothetical protein
MRTLSIVAVRFHVTPGVDDLSARNRVFPTL